MILPRASINSVLLNSAREMDSIPLVMDYKHFDGTVIPELVVPTNELILAISRVSTDLNIPQGDGFQDAYEMVMNAVFSQNTNNIFVMQIISAVMLHVQFHSKLMNGAAVSLVENIESRFRRSVETLSYRLEENVGSIDCPFTAIIVHGPGNLSVEAVDEESDYGFDNLDADEIDFSNKSSAQNNDTRRQLPRVPRPPSDDSRRISASTAETLKKSERQRELLRKEMAKRQKEKEAGIFPRNSVLNEDTVGTPVEHVSGVVSPSLDFKNWTQEKRNRIPKGTDRESRRAEGNAIVANTRSASRTAASPVIQFFSKKIQKGAAEASAELRALDKRSVEQTRQLNENP